MTETSTAAGQRRGRIRPPVGDSAADRAYSHVKEEIVAGRIRGGDLLSEGEVADRLAMSRTPVREAFLRLQAEGWMKLYPKRGAAVVPIRPEEVDEVIEARALLESHAVGRIAGDADAVAGLSSRLHTIVDRQAAAAAADDVAGFATADADFHAAIAAAAGNQILIDFYAGLRDRQRRMTGDSLRRTGGARERIIDQHRRLVAAIEAADAAGFAAAITDHLDDIHRR